MLGESVRHEIYYSFNTIREIKRILTVDDLLHLKVRIDLLGKLEDLTRFNLLINDN
jgi:hypothetical protein